MNWHYADQDVSVGIDYLVGDQFVVPTSATYSVRKSDGTVLATGQMPAAATNEALVVAAANNGLTGGNEFEQRFITIIFVYAGQTYQDSKAYGIFSFVPLTATPQDVRREIGLDLSELPDNEIDIPQAYFVLSSIHGTTFTDAFTSSDIKAISANRAVALQAAIDIVESLPLRTFSMMRSEDSQVERFSGIDFDKLASNLKSKLSNELEVAKNTTVTQPTIFDVSTPTDVITNT